MKKYLAAGLIALSFMASGCAAQQEADRKVANGPQDEAMVARAVEDYVRVAYGVKDMKELDRERLDRVKNLLYDKNELSKFESLINEVLKETQGVEASGVEVVSSSWEVRSGRVVFKVVADVEFGDGEVVKRFGIGLVKTSAGFRVANVVNL